MYQVITNFNGGLDARKFFLSLPPGTLTGLVNGHITQGGEIEKRKAFIPTPLPLNVHGAQPTANGLVVFGSRDTPTWHSTAQSLGTGATAGWVLIQLAATSEMPLNGDLVNITGSSVPAFNGQHRIGVSGGSITLPVPAGLSGSNWTDALTITLAFNSPVSYQRLQHPVTGVTMTGVVSSTYFNGQTFAITSWSNGDTLAFYGTELLKDFYVGEYGSLEPTAYSAADDLCAALAASGNYTATPPALNKLYFQVTGGSTGLISVNYNFGREADLTAAATVASALIADAVPFTTDASTTAANLASAISDTTDALIGGPGNNLGFSGSVSTNLVTVTSPFGVQASDSLSIATYAVGTLTKNGSAISSGDTVTLGRQTYTFATAINSGSAPYSVLRGTGGTDALNNLIAAINGGPGAGTAFSSGTLPNPQATAGPLTGSSFQVVDNTANTNGSEVATTTTSAALAWGAATLQNDITTYTPSPLAQFEVAAIPSQSSAKPFAVSTVDNNCALTYQLVTNGTPATAAVGAVGQFSLIAGSSNPFATATITISAVPKNNDAVTVGAITYTFASALTGTPNEILINSTSLAASLQNLVAAINGTSGAGTAYSLGTEANTAVSASAASSNATTLTASKGGSWANNSAQLPLSTTSSALTLAAFSGGGAAAAATLASNGTNVADGVIVTVAGTAYRFKTTKAQANDVQIATSSDPRLVANGGALPAAADATLNNLLLAINGTGTAGSGTSGNYYTGTAKNPNVLVTNQDTVNHRLTFTALATGTTGNSLALAKSGTADTTLSLSGANFTGGGTDTNQVTQITIGTTSLLQNYVVFNQDLNTTAADIVAAINNYQGTSGFSAAATNNVISLIANNPGASVNEAPVSIQCSGNVCVGNSFVLVSGTGNISAITANSTTQLLTATLTYQDTGYAGETLAQFCARVAANLNANTAVSGFLACAAKNQIWFSRATATDSDSVALAATGTLGLLQGSTTGLTATVNTNTVSFVFISAAVFSVQTFKSVGEPNSVIVTVTGGVPPYTYQWSALAGTNAVPQQTAGGNTQWWMITTTAKYSPTTEQWICTVTDANSPTPNKLVVGPFYLIDPPLNNTGF